jgi:hypothetical protein
LRRIYALRPVGRFISRRDAKAQRGGGKGQIKKAYREASRLCHPDLVPDEIKELIQDLNDWGEYFENIRQQLIEEYDTLASGEVALLE